MKFGGAPTPPPPPGRKKEIIKKPLHENGRDERLKALEQWKNKEAEVLWNDRYQSIKIDMAQMIAEAESLLPETIQSSAASKNSLKTEDVQKNLTDFIGSDHPLPTRDEIQTIVEWVTSDAALLKERAEIVEREFQNLLNSGKQLNLGAFVLLPELEQAIGSGEFAKGLTAAISNHGNIDGFLKHFIALNRLNDPTGNVFQHQLLDFCQTYFESVQNIVPTDKEYEEMQMDAGYDAWDGPPSFTDHVTDFLHSQLPATENYLMQKHMQDVLKSTSLWGESEEAISGSPGGARDENIYAFRALADSMELRRALGVWDGYVIANVLAPIAPGYVGYYKHNKLEKVFPLNIHTTQANIPAEDAACIAKNNHEEYDWIYDALNEPLPPGSHPSNGLNKLHILWDLAKDLRERGGEFYFDLTRINLEDLHPTVRGDILDRNLTYLQKYHLQNDVQALSPEKFNSLLSPTKEAAPADEYLYKTFSSLGMRKKIEEEFGFSIAELTFQEQMHFLSHLNTQTEESFEGVKEFSKEFGINAMRTFLVISEDRALQEKVFAFAQEVPQPEAKKVFDAYGELVGTINNLETYLQETFGKNDPKRTSEIVQKILTRAKTLLANAHEYRDKPQELAALVESIKTDSILFYEGFRTLRESGDIADFTNIAGLEFGSVEAVGAFTDADKAEMKRIVLENYAISPEEFKAAVVGSLETAFEKSGTRFFVLRYNGKVIGFNRFDTLESGADGKPREYFGSFNVDHAFANGKVGDVMIEQTVLKEAQRAVLEADCDPRSPVTPRYIETGFVARELVDYSGVPSFHIIFDAEANTASVAKSLSQAEFFKKAEANEVTDVSVYAVSENVPDFLLLAQKYSLTRYLRRDGRYYAAFEKLPPQVGVQV